MKVVMPMAVPGNPALTRLGRLAVLDAADVRAVGAATANRSIVPPRREVVREGEPIEGARLVLDGWAARTHVLADGRRQLQSFLLPGDLIGSCRHARPCATSTVIALTEVTLCRAPAAAGLPGLAEAYAVSAALDEAYLLAQITRLGRLNAQERIASLLLELNDRMELAGLSTSQGFDLPLTQETIADAMGLTSVHVNRMLQSLRRQNDMVWKGGLVNLPDRARLARAIGHVPARVTAIVPAPDRRFPAM